jgi:hypothetical protein
VVRPHDRRSCHHQFQEEKTVMCQKCGKTMPPLNKICGLCGHRQQEPAPMPKVEKKVKK